MAGPRRTPSGGVFLSYRLRGTNGMAGRLYDRLTDSFGSADVVMDVATEAGDPAATIDRAVSSCVVMVVLIGSRPFLHANPPGTQYVDDPDGIVALEVGSALRHGLTVVPVLTGGASMPRVYDVAQPLAPVTRRHPVWIEHDTFRRDADRLTRALRSVLDGDTPPPGSSAPGSRVGHLFVSYAREDEPAVRPLIEALGRRHRLWVDTVSTIGGDDWDQQVMAAIEDASALLLLLSPRSVRSPAVRKEVRYAENERIRIVPILTEPVVELPDWYRFHFDYLHRIPAFGHDGVERAAAEVSRAISRPD